MTNNLLEQPVPIMASDIRMEQPRDLGPSQKWPRLPRHSIIGTTMAAITRKHAYSVLLSTSQMIKAASMLNFTFIHKNP
jgi:hypothetical protein